MAPFETDYLNFMSCAEHQVALCKGIQQDFGFQISTIGFYRIPDSKIPLLTRINVLQVSLIAGTSQYLQKSGKKCFTALPPPQCRLLHLVGYVDAIYRLICMQMHKRSQSKGFLY